jgi:hypothetical protein
MKMKAPRSFKTSETSHPTTQRHMQEDVNPWQHAVRTLNPLITSAYSQADIQANTGQKQQHCCSQHIQSLRTLHG